MTITHEPPEVAQPARRRLGWWILGLVVLLALAGLATLVLMSSDTDPRIDTVVEFEAAWDAADYDAWASMLAEPPVPDEAAEISQEMEAMAAFGRTQDLQDCQIVAEGYRQGMVRCRSVADDDFYAPNLAGEESCTHFYRVQDDEIVDVEVVDCLFFEGARNFKALERAFGDWLELNQPDLYAAVYDIDSGQPKCSAMAYGACLVAALPYVDDFVSQSEEYPQTE